MSGLFRKSSLDRLSSPDELNKTITITSPMSWLALIGVTIIILIVVIWAFTGTLPTTITTNGIIVSPVSTNAIYADDTGSVTRISVVAGANISIGDEIAVIYTSTKEQKVIFSTQNGTVSEILVKKGEQVYQGSEIVRVSPKTDAEHVVVCYVPFSNSPKLTPGMDVLVYPLYVDKQLYGHMYAKIVNVDTYAATKKNMSYVLGIDNSLADSYASNGAVVAVACELIRDDQTTSGYYWSSAQGQKLKVTSGQQVSVKIITERNAPITKLFIKLKTFWEG